MKKKRDNCKYCNEPMDAKTTRKEFCSVKCKVYWHRDNEPKKVAPKKEESDKSTQTGSKKEGEVPKNLYELKKLCPENITGLARTAWIFDKKKEYGITN